MMPSSLPNPSIPNPLGQPINRAPVPVPRLIFIENHSNIPWHTEQDVYLGLLNSRESLRRLRRQINYKTRQGSPYQAIHLYHPLILSAMIITGRIKENTLYALLHARRIGTPIYRTGAVNYHLIDSSCNSNKNISYLWYI
jgi:hypothetical protein